MGQNVTLPEYSNLCIFYTATLNLVLASEDPWNLKTIQVSGSYPRPTENKFMELRPGELIKKNCISDYDKHQKLRITMHSK